MKFGRVPDEQLQAIDLSLPADHPRTAELLARLPKRANKPEFFLGCPVWGHKGYVGTLYPKGTRQADFLKAYGQQFNTIELNSTHYGVPAPAQIERWAEAVPDGFRFCPKWPQRISHRSRINEYLPMIDQFLEAIYAFGPKLGMTFLQLPPWFGPDGLERLHQLLAALPTDLETAVEFRHPDWLASQTVSSELFDMLETVGMAAAITDVAGRRDVCHMALTCSKLLVRFTGNNLHQTDFERATAWTERLAHWFTNNLQTVYFLLHQPDEENFGELAVHVAAQLKKQGAVTVTPPVLYHRQQQALF